MRLGLVIYGCESPTDTATRCCAPWGRLIAFLPRAQLHCHPSGTAELPDQHQALPWALGAGFPLCHSPYEPHFHPQWHHSYIAWFWLCYRKVATAPTADTVRSHFTGIGSMKW